MGRLWLVPVLLSACSDPAAQPDAGVDAAALDAEQAALTITPSAFNFGDLELGAPASLAQTFRIDNASARAVDLASVAVGGANPGDFEITDNHCGASLASGDGCTVDLRFDPAARDARSAQLEVMGPTLVSAFIQGTAIVRSMKLIFDPGSHDFGEIGVGDTSTPFDFTVINEAAATMLTPSVAPSSDYSIVGNTCTGTVALHATCTISVQWAPSFSGAQNATLEVTAGAAGMWGAGLRGASAHPLSITPATGLMGSVLIGQSEATQERSFSIVNEGTATTGTLAVSFTGAGAADYELVSTTCTAPLASGESCSVTAHLAPITRGVKGAQLVVTDGGSTNIAEATLSGSVYTLFITGDASFPTTASGQQSAIQMVTVLNPSDHDSGAVTTSLGAQFAIASNTCAGGVVAHGSCSIGVRFTPSTSGAKLADLTVSATPGGSFTLQLSGTGQ